MTKTPDEIAGIRQAGRIVAGALACAGAEVRPGVTLEHLARVCDQYIRDCGGYPTFLRYRGFPAPVCVSLNAEVVHGIPDTRVLVAGDIVKLDVGVTKDGLIADAARTFAVGTITPELRQLIAVTEKSFWAGAEQARAGKHVSDIGHAVQRCVERHGYSIVRDLCGHGVGRALHEEPSVPNFGPAGRGVRLVAGMILAIEPMVNLGGPEVVTASNGWTVLARDGRPSAHYENTVLVTAGEPEILTAAPASADQTS
ncbi:MAG: type I methionyl aminopeptidase [candidate division WOR-3 bacterium]